MKLLQISALAAFLMGAFAQTSQAGCFFGPVGPVCTPMSADDVNNGNYCEVNGVHLLAKTEADCTTAGGKVVQSHADAIKAHTNEAEEATQ